MRSLQEYDAGHLPGAVHAPGGQLVQATDQWVGTRGARLVLCDDTGLRAATTAIWLRGMGHDARILGIDVTNAENRSAVAETTTVLKVPERPVLHSPFFAQAMKQQGLVLIDVNPGMTYRQAHIDGARWATRARLQTLNLVPRSPVIVIATDLGVARAASADLEELGCVVMGVFGGRADDWRNASLPVTSTPTIPADADCIDYLFFVHDRHDGNLDAARAYLSWETGLMAQMDAQETGVLRPLV